MDELTTVTPPLTVFVPSLRVAPGDEQASVVLRQVAAETLVLPAYTSLDALVRCCGEQQPWVALPADVADALAEQAGAEAVVLDAVFTDPVP